VLKVIFFDAAGTLIEPRAPVGATYANVACNYGIATTAEIVDGAFRRVFRQAPGLAFGPGHGAAELRDLERRWWRELVAASFKGLAEFTDFGAYFDDLFALFADPATWRSDLAALPTLRRLGARGFALGMISNFDHRLYRILEGLGLAGQFQSVTISSEAGYAKPSPEIFRIALAKHGANADEALHVGDSEHLDVAGATAAGIAAVLIDPAAPARLLVEGRTARISSLDAVLEAADSIPFP
jgi:putative hydrolase of the HAD superfamily